MTQYCNFIYTEKCSFIKTKPSTASTPKRPEASMHTLHLPAALFHECSKLNPDVEQRDKECSRLAVFSGFSFPVVLSSVAQFFVSQFFHFSQFPLLIFPDAQFSVALFQLYFFRCRFFTARRYASAVLAVIVCLSVCLSVRHKSELYKDG